MCIRLSLISDVNVEDDYVEFILNGNAGSFQVKRVTELKCEFLSGKTIFEYEEMKNLSMDVSGYVKYDIDYPEGWTVEFDGTKMSVTAPAAPSEWNQTPFDESGLIKIWLYDNKGDVVFDKVMVQIGGTQMVTLSATMTEGVVNVIAETPYASSFYLGVMKAFSAPFTDFYAKPEVGESYVIWAFQENYGGSVSPEDIITVVYESSDDKVQETLLNSWPFNTDYPTTSDVYSNTNLSPNTKGYVFVVVIDNDGKIGPLQKKEVTTTDVPRDATIGVELNGEVDATTTALDESDTAALVSQITSNGNSSTEEFEINRYMYTTVYVYITWTDAEGNYYAPVKVEIPMPA